MNANEATVYRVERDDGAGPYRTLTYENIHDDDYSETYRGGRRPSPWDDGLERVQESDYFAFVSLCQLRYWFNERDRTLLASHGFHIAVYRVATHLVRRGGCQCIFCKSQATLERVEALA